LSEQDVVKLLSLGASNNAVSDLVQKYGVNFQADEDTLQRLKKAGAEDTLLRTIRGVALPAKPSAATSTAEDLAKLLAAARHVKLAQLKAQDKDWVSALKDLDEAEKIYPKLADIFYQRGLVLAAQQRYGDAAAEWKKYINLAGSEADLRSVQDRIIEWEYVADKNEKMKRLVEQGKQHLEDFNIESAIAEFEEALKIQPSLALLLNLADAYWRKPDSAALAKVAAQALVMDPRSYQALLYKGAAEMGQQAIDQSIVTLGGALTLEPNSAFGHALLCEAFRLKGDLKKAELQCDRALLIDPNCALAHDRLGAILLKRRGYPAAVAEVRRAVQAEPKNPFWQTDLAYILMGVGDVEGAIMAAQGALHLDPKNPYAHDAMGQALEMKGKLDLAIQEYKEAVRLGGSISTQFEEHLRKATRR
jgi:tetratricopeptide (TPR) repeat protein